MQSHGHKSPKTTSFPRLHADPVRERVRSRLYTVLSPKPKRWPGGNVTGEVLGSSGVVAAIVPEE
jgi:hypothetical protein